jgi:hypothetical protein
MPEKSCQVQRNLALGIRSFSFRTRMRGILVSLVSFAFLLFVPHISYPLTKKEAVLLAHKAEVGGSPIFPAVDPTCQRWRYLVPNRFG